MRLLKQQNSNVIVRVMTAEAAAAGVESEQLTKSLRPLLQQYVHDLQNSYEMNETEKREKLRVVVALLASGVLKITSSNAKHILFLFDSGSNAHLTNCKDVFVPGSIRKCNVNVFGVNANDEKLAMFT